MKCSEKDLILESIIETKTAEIPQSLLEWLNALPNFGVKDLFPLTSDAGFRRYYRMLTNQESFVVMDASMAHESCHAFIAVANALREQKVRTPIIFAADVARGYLVLSDFGDVTYLNALNYTNAEFLYEEALRALAKIQLCDKADEYVIPPFSKEFMWQEWAWHKEWVTEKMLNVSVPLRLMRAMDEAMAKIIHSAASQPQLFMHRDYHSANLMVLDNDVGVLDFQDAYIGPVTYDLVSLLKDCYVDWPPEKVLHWALTYKQTLLTKKIADRVSNDEFLQWFDFMGVQRHLKAMLTFARKKVRDQNDTYLRYLPRTLMYLRDVTTRYTDLLPMHHYLQDFIMPALAEQGVLCAQ